MAEELKKNISRLTEQEAKSILLNMLITIEMQQDGGVPKDEFCERMIDFLMISRKEGISRQESMTFKPFTSCLAFLLPAA
ncbi:hypothetical protein ACH95_03865 [Bacillus glycinifermentans]|nr:hypothetical protein ACH95_03865 [Bacillus glycinifermentans]